MAFMSDGHVGFAHIDTYAKFAWFLWFGLSNYRVHPWGRIDCHVLYEVKLLQFFQLFLDFLSDMEGNSSVSVLDWLNSLVNVQLNLYTSQVVNAFKYVIVFFTEFQVTISSSHWWCFTHFISFGDIPKLHSCLIT